MTVNLSDESVCVCVCMCVSVSEYVCRVDLCSNAVKNVSLSLFDFDWLATPAPVSAVNNTPAAPLQCLHFRVSLCGVEAMGISVVTISCVH